MEKARAVISVLILGLVVVLIMALPTMWAWDAIMPKYFGLKEITFTDAIWLNVLASCLFKSTSNTNSSN